MDNIDTSKLTDGQLHTVGLAESAWKVRQIQAECVKDQDTNVLGRCTTEEWLDENEHEWNMMVDMVCDRPWALKKPRPKYPFREVTNAMREIEGPWVGDMTVSPNIAIEQHINSGSDPLVHIFMPTHYPPTGRIILFTPEFGAGTAYDHAAWKVLTQPAKTTDLWCFTWQGLSKLETTIAHAVRRLRSFGDSISTVWYAHSAGAIIAYEVLRRFEKISTPAFPVALVVSGCPAPHLFRQEFKMNEEHPWLTNLRARADFDKVTDQQLDKFKRDGCIGSTLTALSRSGIIMDNFLLGTYCYKQSEHRLLIPVIALSHDNDGVVEPDSVKEWEEYAPIESFEHVELEDFEDTELLDDQGHGYGCIPNNTIVKTIIETLQRYQRDRTSLPDIGPVDSTPPDEVDVVVVGGGISGINTMHEVVKSGKSAVCLERREHVGGIWYYYANPYSRVNSSEPAYRLVSKLKPGDRPNEDHTPTYDILHDIRLIASQHCYGKFCCNQEVTKVTKREDGTRDVECVSVLSGKSHTIHTKAVSFNVNRRISMRRVVEHKGEKNFAGQIAYGYAGEVVGIDFWKKRVIVVGAGAFAYENLRTALEHGARHVTVLGRRSGTTCPKWIDMIAFLRPKNESYATNAAGNVISFEAWKKCFTDAGLPTPECWDEGLLKPHNHTVSVSDLVFIAAHYGMAALTTGEIDHYKPDGTTVVLKNGTSIQADVIIKATGFHLNNSVPEICGYSKMNYLGYMDVNLIYQAEPLLDGGQFGSSKGKIELQVEDDAKEEDLAAAYRTAVQSGLEDLFLPKMNPFGSAYVGGMRTTAKHFAWSLNNEDKQRTMFELIGQPQLDCVEFWASFTGQGAGAVSKKLLLALTKQE